MQKLHTYSIWQSAIWSFIYLCNSYILYGNLISDLSFVQQLHTPYCNLIFYLWNGYMHNIEFPLINNGFTMITFKDATGICAQNGIRYVIVILLTVISCNDATTWMRVIRNTTNMCSQWHDICDYDFTYCDHLQRCKSGYICGLN